MKRIISTGVEKAEWDDGEMQSSPIGTPRVSEISRLTLSAGSFAAMAPPMPWLSFSSTILTWVGGGLGELLGREPSDCARRNSPSPSPR